MLIQHYTTFDDIRAALGVGSKELKDDTLTLDLYSSALMADLEDVSLAVPTTYTQALSSDPQSDAEIRFINAAKVFATYSVAKHLTVSLPVFSPVKIEDGKAAMTRANDPHRETVAAVNREFERWKSRLLAAYQSLVSESSVSVQRDYLSVISPAEDPVTGL